LKEIPEGCFLYLVGKNESPATIAEKFNTEHTKIVELNKTKYPSLKKNSKLLKDTPLLVPGNAPEEDVAVTRRPMTPPPLALS